MKTVNKNLKRQIMRRVYYAYTLQIFSHPAFPHGMALSMSVALLAQAVSIPAILANLSATPVGMVPTYLIYSSLKTETFVLLLLGAVVFTILSFGVTIKTVRVKRLQTI